MNNPSNTSVQFGPWLGSTSARGTLKGGWLGLILNYQVELNSCLV